MRINSSENFKEKVTEITGAGSGIGRSLAVQLNLEGAHLALGDIDSEGFARPAACFPKIPR